MGNDRDRLSSLKLIKDTYSEKMNLLTNPYLLQDSIKFVEGNIQKLQDSSTNRGQQDLQEQVKESCELTKF